MAGTKDFSDTISTTEGFILRFTSALSSIDPRLSKLIEFKLSVQKRNLMALVEEADERILQYEHIYPYIKELCHGQTINPAWQRDIEKVLNHALSKGRGRKNALTNEIKEAWVNYIVLLSCAMIDKETQRQPVSRKLYLKTEKGKLIGIMGKNP